MNNTYLPCDLLFTKEDLILRIDGLTIHESEADPQELKDSLPIPKNTTCMYVKDHDNDSEYVVVTRNAFGSIMMIEKKYVQKASK